MARVGVLQHFWCENEGVLGTVLSESGHEIARIPLFEGAKVPPMEAFDAWIVMGGPMNVDETDKYPYLLSERALMADLIRADRPLIGVCLGCQMIARAAGAVVRAQRPKEIGLFDVELTPAAARDPLFSELESPLEVFQWHGDTYDLPAGAVQLARSERYEQQAFRLGRRVYGLQFHLECTMEIVERLADACADELAELPPEDAWERHEGRLGPGLARQNELARRLIVRWSELF